MKADTMHQIVFTAAEQAELQTTAAPSDPLPPDEVRGRTLASLISTGTELAIYQGFEAQIEFPHVPGYAAVFEVEAVGSAVDHLRPGDRALCMGRHQSYQQVVAKEALPLPPDLPAEEAVFARLMNVPMATLTTTAARPPAKVVVVTLGLVGNLAAQIFHRCGYEVIAYDRQESRRRLARDLGIPHVFDDAPLNEPRVAGQVSLVLECSGYEQALLDGCRLVHKGGEVVLVGVPWRARSPDLSAHEIYRAVFFDYVIVRSGWEWELPRHRSDFQPNSTFGNMAGALAWLADGRIKVDNLYTTTLPADPQAIYQKLLRKEVERPALVLDWTAL